MTGKNFIMTKIIVPSEEVLEKESQGHHKDIQRRTWSQVMISDQYGRMKS
jgi:hypothetical protein